MYRTDQAHQWGPTSYMPMSSAYARTLYDEAALMMTGDTRPAPFGYTQPDADGERDAVDVRRSGFPVDVNTDSLPLDVLDSRLMDLEDWHLPHMGGRPNDADAEIESARIAGARMGGGMQDVSRPVPLERDRSVQHKASRAADLVMVALAIGCAIGWFAGLLR